MNRLLMVIVILMCIVKANATAYFGSDLCKSSEFDCVRVSSGQNWEKMFPDPVKRDLVQRLNRTYNSIWAGREIVVPKNIDDVTLFDLSPFPLKKEKTDSKEIIVDQEKLAWGAYDAEGKLVFWGPISSGRDKCSDSNNSCRTQTGSYRFFSKESDKCRSGVFPIGKGGAKMPYCMYYHKGFALHGAEDMPGVRASHGCVRMFTRDAKWLNENFVELSNAKNNFLGTKIVVLPLKTTEKKL